MSPLDTVVFDDLHTKQNTRHRFRIHAPILLAESLFARRCRQINASAKTFTLIMPVQLSIFDCVEKRSELAPLLIQYL